MILSNMTETMMQHKATRGIFPTSMICEIKDIEYVESRVKVSIKHVSQKQKSDEPLNFYDGIIVKHVAYTIMLECDRATT